MPKKKVACNTNYLVPKPGANLSILGLSSAELDADLATYYVDPERYVARALDFKDPAVFFVGPKGAGKSAILQMVRLTRAADIGRVINISPDDLAFSALANITASTPLMSDASKNQWLFKALWDYILALEVLRREHKDRSSFSNALHKIVQFFFGNSHHKEANKLLAISLGDDGQQHTLSSRIIELVKEVEVSAEAKDVGKVTGKTKLEGKVATGNHLWLLNLIHSVAKRIGDNLSAPYHILIDDLDLHWQDTPVQNAFIAALFMSLRTFAKGGKLKCVVAIRDQIYRKLPLDDRDKYHDWVCNVEWDSPNLKKMIERRITSKISVLTKDIWNGLLPNGAFAKMHNHSYGRPREAIRLVSLCVAEASRKGHSRVEQQDLTESIRKFSDMRITEISDEFKNMYTGLEPIIRKLNALPKEFCIQRLKDITSDIWLEIECKDDIAQNYPWAGGFVENPKGFAMILLECRILLYKTTQKAVPIIFDLDASPEVIDASWVAIHPVFWPALGLD